MIYPLKMDSLFRTLDSSLAIQMSPFKSLTLIMRYMRPFRPYFLFLIVKECRWAIWWYLASPSSRPHCSDLDCRIWPWFVAASSTKISLCWSAISTIYLKARFSRTKRKSSNIVWGPNCSTMWAVNVCCSGERTRGGQSSLRGHDILCFCSILSEPWLWVLSFGTGKRSPFRASQKSTYQLLASSSIKMPRVQLRHCQTFTLQLGHVLLKYTAFGQDPSPCLF